VIGEHARGVIYIGEHEPHGLCSLRSFHLLDHFFGLVLHPGECGALLVRLGIGIDFVEWKVINRIALLIDAIDRLLAKLMSETKRDLGTFVRIPVQRFRGEFLELPGYEIGPIGQRFDRNLTRIEFCETRRDVAQLGLLGRGKDAIDFHIVHILTGIAEMIGAEHHHLDGG